MRALLGQSSMPFLLLNKVARNFRLLIDESLAEEILLHLRCDNEATLAMLENPSWRSKYLSIYGEAIRQGTTEQSLILTYVNTDQQLAEHGLSQLLNRSMVGSIHCGVWCHM